MNLSINRETRAKQFSLALLHGKIQTL